MYAKSTRPSAKREVQKERSAKRDDRNARPGRAQTCERSELRAKRAMRMCPRSGQICLFNVIAFRTASTDFVGAKSDGRPACG